MTKILLGLRSCLIDRQTLDTRVCVLFVPIIVVVDGDHGGAVLVLHLDVDLPGDEALAWILLRAVVIYLNEPLDIMERAGELHVGVVWRKSRLR